MFVSLCFVLVERFLFCLFIFLSLFCLGFFLALDCLVWLFGWQVCSLACSLFWDARVFFLFASLFALLGYFFACFSVCFFGVVFVMVFFYSPSTE